jgi:hypothetical protein
MYIQISPHRRAPRIFVSSVGVAFIVNLSCVATLGGYFYRNSDTKWRLETYMPTVIAGIICDVALFILPMPQIWTLKIDFRQKMRLTITVIIVVFP